MPFQTLTDLAKGLASGEYSSRELTQYYLDRCQRYDTQLNGYTTLTAEHALAAADTADKQRQAGKSTALTGIPLAQKDIFCTKGIKTACGSKMLDNFIPPYDATVIQRCQQAGLVMLGKTNMDEFAMGSSGENSYYGPSLNPWNTDCVPGGSSSGSATVVAADLAPAATGTDTGGSVRQPAAFCGLTGLKPTYGRISRYGMIAFASSLDQCGTFTHTAEDAALLLNVLAGHDKNDSTSASVAVPDYTQRLADDISGLTIGLPEEYFTPDLDPNIAGAVEAALEELRKLGAKTVPVSLPNYQLAVPAYYIIAPAEASSNLARYDGVRYGYRCEDPVDLIDLYERTRSEGFGAEVKRRILIGTYALSAGYYDAYYIKAQQARQLIRQDFQRAFEHVDVIASPTAPSTAFRLGEKTADPVTMYLSDIYTIAVNLAGLPALSLPVGFANQLPVGMQLIGNDFNEARLLNVAHRLQQATDWHQQHPAAFNE